MFVCLYFLCDVEVAGVDAVYEQILCAAALTGPKHTVVGLEQLTAGRRGHFRNQQHPRRTLLPILDHDYIQNVPASDAALPIFITMLNAEPIISYKLLAGPLFLCRFTAVWVINRKVRLLTVQMLCWKSFCWG